MVLAAKATVWPLWWLPIVLMFIALVVAAIIIFVTCSLYRNRGDDYDGINTQRVRSRCINISLVSCFYNRLRASHGSKPHALVLADGDKRNS